MNRLTERIGNIAVCTKRYEMRSPCHYCEYQSTDECENQKCSYAAVLDKLATYEDEEEQGLLIRLLYPAMWELNSD